MFVVINQCLIAIFYLNQSLESLDLIIYNFKKNIKFNGENFISNKKKTIRLSDFYLLFNQNVYLLKNKRQKVIESLKVK